MKFFFTFISTGILVCSLYSCHSSRKAVTPKTLLYLGVYENEQDIAALYDTLSTPLLIYKNNIVFQMHADCIATAFAGASNDRNNGAINNNRTANGNANNRLVAGISGERKEKGKYKNRNKGGSNNDRISAGESNNRTNTGTVNNRFATGAANNRLATGETQTYSCELNKKGKLLLHLKKVDKNDFIKIYYNHFYYDKKYFSIKAN